MRRLGRDKEYRASERRTVIEGWVLVDEALRSGIVPEALYVVASECAGVESRGIDGPCFMIGESSMAAISVLESPPGVLAVVATPFVTPDEVEDGLILLLVDISDPGNAGTLVRSAEAAGFDEVLLAGNSVDVTSPKVIRAAAGSAFRMKCGRLGTFDDLRRRGVTVLGLTSATGVDDGTSGNRDTRLVESLYDIALAPPLAIAVGSEAHGLPPDLPVDRWVNIPHHGPAESLNAAMAGTVACMHVGHRLRGNDALAPTLQD